MNIIRKIKNVIENKLPQKGIKSKKMIKSLSVLAPIAISCFSLMVSIDSRNISKLSYDSAQELEPLQYYLKPIVTNYNDGVINTEVEIIVTNGAVGDVRAIDYQNGEIIDVANNIGGTIDKSSDKSERTFGFEFICDDKYDEYIMTVYLIVNGRDGSKNIGMILYHVNLKSRIISAEYYSTEDLLLSELDSSKGEYRNAFINYRELIKILSENLQL